PATRDTAIVAVDRMRRSGSASARSSAGSRPERAAFMRAARSLSSSAPVEGKPHIPRRWGRRNSILLYSHHRTQPSSLSVERESGVGIQGIVEIAGGTKGATPGAVGVLGPRAGAGSVPAKPAGAPPDPPPPPPPPPGTLFGPFVCAPPPRIGGPWRARAVGL